MTLAPHDQVTLDRITGIMPDPERLSLSEFDSSGRRYALSAVALSGSLQMAGVVLPTA